MLMQKRDLVIGQLMRGTEGTQAFSQAPRGGRVRKSKEGQWAYHVSLLGKRDPCARLRVGNLDPGWDGAGSRDLEDLQL